MTDKRLQQLFPAVELGVGDHDTPAHGMCIMELITWLSGELHSDRPLSVCPVLRGFAMALNDGISSPKLRSDLLLPLLPLLIGSRDERLMKPRADLLSVWAVREAVSLLADAMGQYAVADACRNARDRPAALSAALLGRNDSIYSEAVAAASSPEDPEVSALWPNAVEKRGGYAGTVFARTLYQLLYDHTSQLDETIFWATAADCLRQAALIKVNPGCWELGRDRDIHISGVLSDYAVINR